MNHVALHATSAKRRLGKVQRNKNKQRKKNHENSANDRKNRNNRKEAVANKPLHSSKNAIANPNKLQRAAPLAIVTSPPSKKKQKQMNEIAARTSSNATPSKSTVKQRQTIETEAKTLQKACMTKKPNANFFHGIAQAANNNNMLLPISQAGKDKSKMKLRKKAQMQRTIEKPCKKTPTVK